MPDRRYPQQPQGNLAVHHSGPNGIDPGSNGMSSPGPPSIVVSASAEMPSDPMPLRGLGDGATPPRNSTLNRLRAGPKDTIPAVKPPRKQRSSRFIVTEKVDIEKLPTFAGESEIPYASSPFGRSHRWLRHNRSLLVSVLSFLNHADIDLKNLV